MNADDFAYQRLDLSMTAGMNQRYHQARSHWWICWNRAVQIAVGLLAVIGACLAVSAASVDNVWVDVSAILFASLAAVAAIALNVLPLGDWAQEHLDLFRRWSDLREDVDALEFEQPPGAVGDIPRELVDRLKALDAKKHRICGIEPAMNERLLEKCYRDENRSRETAAEHTGHSGAPPVLVSGGFGLTNWQ